MSTVKTYAKLALKAGTLDATEYALIRAVEGYSRKEAKRLDEGREAAGIPTRNGRKKGDPVSFTPGQAEELKRQRTRQGRRIRPRTDTVASAAGRAKRAAIPASIATTRATWGQAVRAIGRTASKSSPCLQNEGREQ